MLPECDDCYGEVTMNTGEMFHVEKARFQSVSRGTIYENN